MRKEFRGDRHQQGAARCRLPRKNCEPLRVAAEADLGATIVERGIADCLVEFLGNFRIPAEVIPDGRYFRVKTYPIPPEGTH